MTTDAPRRGTTTRDKLVTAAVVVVVPVVLVLGVVVSRRLQDPLAASVHDLVGGDLVGLTLVLTAGYAVFPLGVLAVTLVRRRWGGWAAAVASAPVVVWWSGVWALSPGRYERYRDELVDATARATGDPLAGEVFATVGDTGGVALVLSVVYLLGSYVLRQVRRPADGPTPPASPRQRVVSLLLFAALWSAVAWRCLAALP